MKGSLSTYSLFRKMIIENKDIYMLSQEDVEAVQRVLLGMMDDIHRVCEMNGLTYVLSGGCALGTVRHGGFIPWDDDIDICMPRKDYDRFRDYLLEAYPDTYYVQEIRSCENYDLNFMKVRLKNSVFCEFLDPEPEKSGIFIDIFPVENVSDGILAGNLQWLMSDGMQFICSCIRIRKKRERLLAMSGGLVEAKRMIRVKSALALPFSLIPFRKWLLWTEKILMRNGNDHTKKVSIPTGGRHFKGETYPREWLFPPRLTQFEDRKYYTMAHVEKYLTQMYGDYMTLPPVEQRERHALLAFSLPEGDCK